MANAKDEHHRILCELEKEAKGFGLCLEDFVAEQLKFELWSGDQQLAIFQSAEGHRIFGLLVGLKVIAHVGLFGEEEEWYYEYEADVLPLAVRTEDYTPGCPGCVNAEPPGSHEATCPVHSSTVDLKVSPNFTIDYGLKAWLWTSRHGGKWKW